MIKIRALLPFVFNWRGGRIRMEKGEIRTVSSAVAESPWLKDKIEILADPVPNPVPIASLPKTESTEEPKPVRRRGRRPKNASSSNG